jgi:hypothetical protein
MRKTISLLRRVFPGYRAARFAVACATIVAAACVASAQPGNNQQPGNLPNVLFPPGGQPQNGLVGGTGVTTGRQGASANADFESLIDLIQSTVATETWAENGGGEAEIRPFPGGVLVDAAGTLRLRSPGDVSLELAAKHGAAPASAKPRSGDVRADSTLRYISLPRLELEIARRQKAREPLEPAMLTLAGLQRVQYVFVYPESGDLVLAGPAGDWFVDPSGRILSADTQQPVVRLDDLLVLLRRGAEAADSFFGCSINPRQDALAKTQAFLASTSQKPLQPGQRKTWLREICDTVGKQDIEIFGIDPASRVAAVLVEADYHMKLIGIGLADGVDGVDSYLDTVKLASERAGARAPSAADGLPPMTVLRWWFALNYDAVNSSPKSDAFQLVGQGVLVRSENEMLAEQGRRVHTGQSDALNSQFAESFTAHFTELAAKYPVYGELRNIFDLAMAVALIESEGLAAKVGWQPGLFANAERLPLPQGAVPRQVETVVNHRVVNRRQIVAGVSGGVMVAPRDVLNDARRASLVGLNTTVPNDASAAWWWDANP